MNAYSPLTRIPGLPGELPAGEAVLWRGAPCWRSLARHLCHVREIAVYFTVLVLGAGVASTVAGATLGQTLLTVAPLLAAAAGTLGFFLSLAWRISRTTEYTLTTHRLVFRFGAALPAVLALPHACVLRASVAIHGDGTGDLPLRMKPGHHLALHRVWPHSRPWHFRSPEPMLRSVPRAGELAALLAQTLAQSAARERLGNTSTCSLVSRSAAGNDAGSPEAFSYLSSDPARL